MRAIAVATIRRMPLEDCLWAKSWKGRTILSTGGCSRTTLMQRVVPAGDTQQPPKLIHQSVFASGALPPCLADLEQEHVNAGDGQRHQREGEAPEQEAPEAEPRHPLPLGEAGHYQVGRRPDQGEVPPEASTQRERPPQGFDGLGVVAARVGQLLYYGDHRGGEGY